MESPSLFISRDPDHDFLSAIEVGRVSDGQPSDTWEEVQDDFAWFIPRRLRRPRGFMILGFNELDPFDLDSPEIWDGSRFSAPTLGLFDVPAGEIVIAAKAYLGDEPTINRAYFQMAMASEGEKALGLWRCCLESGDLMAHFALGYTLYDLGRYHEAYAHLRLYTELSPCSSWNWCWLGKGAAAIGETSEAEDAYRRALELTARGDQKTHADELLARLSAESTPAADDDIPF